MYIVLIKKILICDNNAPPKNQRPFKKYSNIRNEKPSFDLLVNIVRDIPKILVTFTIVLGCPS